MELFDKTIPCKRCGRDFVFSAGEQEYFMKKNLSNQPRHCPDCRVMLRAWRDGHENKMFSVSCASCGGTAFVPFKPKGHKPVYCGDCFHLQKGSPAEAIVSEEGALTDEDEALTDSDLIVDHRSDDKTVEDQE